jgi:hypothetical protein
LTFEISVTEVVGVEKLLDVEIEAGAESPVAKALGEFIVAADSVLVLTC